MNRLVNLPIELFEMVLRFVQNMQRHITYAPSREFGGYMPKSRYDPFRGTRRALTQQQRDFYDPGVIRPYNPFGLFG